MPTVTFNLTAIQAQRIQEATDYYNQRNGTTLTAKQLIWLVARQNVRAWLTTKGTEAVSTAAAATAAALEADLEGEV